MEKIQKKGGIITDLISGVGGLVILVVLILVIVSTLLAANLLGDTTENATAYAMSANLTEGIDNVSKKIPTVLLIAAVVLLLGVLLLLYARARESGLMGSGGGSL